MKKALKAAARGTVFPYAGEKWVVLEHDPAGRTLCLRRSTDGELRFAAGALAAAVALQSLVLFASAVYKP